MQTMLAKDLKLYMQFDDGEYHEVANVNSADIELSETEESNVELKTKSIRGKRSETFTLCMSNDLFVDFQKLFMSNNYRRLHGGYALRKIRR